MSDLWATGELYAVVEGTPQRYLNVFYEYLLQDFGYRGEIRRRVNHVWFVKPRGCLGRFLPTRDKGVWVSAFPVGENRTQLTVSSHGANYIRDLDRFIDYELQERIGGAGGPGPYRTSR